jgi:molybdopterin-biosynthesis enzyme MoeA-like protein
MAHQTAGKRMTLGDKAEQIMHLTLEATRREGDISQSRERQACGLDAKMKLAAPVGVPSGEKIDHREVICVVVAGHQRKAVPLVEETAERVE